MVPATRAGGSRQVVGSGSGTPYRRQAILGEVSMHPWACQSAKDGPIWTQSCLVLTLILPAPWLLLTLL